MSRSVRGKATTVTLLCVLLVGMGGLVSYSATLYRIICQVTGYGGTVQVAENVSETLSKRKIIVRFNADTARGLGWEFQPAQDQVSLRLGEQGLAFFRAENKTATPVTGRATFNVTPAKAGMYFNKVACFCFTEQTLASGESADMPVQFFVDPELENDPNLGDVTTITLSYTFFRAEPEEESDRQAQLQSANPASAAVN